MSALPRTYYTREQYDALELETQTRYEYLDGEIVAMAGASSAYDTIVWNLIVLIDPALRRSRCKGHTADVRVEITESNVVTHPDLIIICGDPAYTKSKLATVTNPTVIVEVLSPSIESYNRRQKFRLYRRLPSLQAYILIAQDEPWIEYFSPETQWTAIEMEGIEASLTIAPLNVSLSLADIYHGVVFQPEYPPTIQLADEE